MISAKFFKFIHIIVTFGYYTRILPWTWDEIRHQIIHVSSVKDRRLYWWNTLFQLCLRIGGIVYLTITILILDLPYYEIILAVFLITGWFHTTTLLLFLRLTRLDVQNLFNACFALNDQQMNFYGLIPSQIMNDSKEKNALMSAAAFSLMALLTGPITACLVNREIKLIWMAEFLCIPKWLVVLVVTYTITIDCCIQLVQSNALYFLVNVIPQWLAKNTCQSPRTPISVKKKLRLICRAHRVLHRYMEEYTNYLMPILFGVIILATILSMFAILDSNNVLDTPLLIGFTLAMMLMLFSLWLGCQRMNSWTHNSMAYSDSFKNVDKYVTKFDKAFLKSVQPIIWRIGPSLKMEDSLFPAILHFIVARVIDLKISSRRVGGSLA